ncbi:MAG: leucyl/phenylalanyl-tRNA--protein transferase [Cellvibrionales bacterium]|nr:leucyl/phenylalanyl-tRNA--protein transferase [Cellvibrionales bacterium]
MKARRRLAVLDPECPRFPPTGQALVAPEGRLDGLLAVGGNLRVETLCAAYRRGIFPWYLAGEPLLWWAPAMRAVLGPGDLHLGRTVRKLMRRGEFCFTADRCFAEVVAHCAALRAGRTWILPAMHAAYIELHRAGVAHSLEVWREGELVGGIYGVQVGGVFCGESMFHRRANAGKLGFICLAQTLFARGFALVDCQMSTPFLATLGVREMPRAEFEGVLADHAGRGLDWPRCWSL